MAVDTREPPTRLEAFVLYVLAAVATLLWVSAVLPAGDLAEPSPIGDAATPLHREPLLVTPALLLLILLPAGSTLAHRQQGMRAVLAGTDAFVTLYGAVTLTVLGVVVDSATAVLTAVLYGLGVLSLMEVSRSVSARERPRRWVPSGARLAICLLVLLIPPSLLMQEGTERASLLAPFLFVAISAGGARLSRGMRGLRTTASLLQLALAAHVLVTLRYTIYAAEPKIAVVRLTGQVTIGLAVALCAVALLDVIVCWRAGRRMRRLGTLQAQPT